MAPMNALFCVLFLLSLTKPSMLAETSSLPNKGKEVKDSIVETEEKKSDTEKGVTEKGVTAMTSKGTTSENYSEIEAKQLEKYKRMVNRVVAFVDALNGGHDNWTATVHTTFALMETEEIEHMMGTRVSAAKQPNQQRKEEQRQKPEKEVPFDLDGRHWFTNCNLFIGTMPDQGRCGSCWAVTAASVLTDRTCIANARNLTKRLSSSQGDSYASAQDTLEFTPNTNGCNGGDPQMAWKWFAESGVTTGSDNLLGSGCKPFLISPFETKRSIAHLEGSFCQQKCDMYWDDTYKKVFKIKGQPTHWEGKAESREEDMMREIMENGPIQVTVTVYPDLLYYSYNPRQINVYTHLTTSVGGTGTAEYPNTKSLGTHSIKLIGWGVAHKETPGKGFVHTKYWIGVNSWNRDWGLNGTVLWRRGVDECGIESLGIDFGTPDV